MNTESYQKMKNDASEDLDRILMPPPPKRLKNEQDGSGESEVNNDNDGNEHIRVANTAAAPQNFEVSSKQACADLQTNSSSLMSTVRFRDIIGHSTAKLRLEEALLPLALPPSLADSILVGMQ